jgi:hypothetical protein
MLRAGGFRSEGAPVATALAGLRAASVACLAVAAGLLGAAACADSGAAPDAPAHTVRDSAGIEIVESGAIGSVVPVELGAPLLDLGAVDGPAEYLFSWVGAVALLDNGRLAVADRSNRVRFYEPDGSYFGSFGREGDGPGEFRGIVGMWPRDDGALVVLDAGQWRLTVVSDGSLASSHPIRPPGMNSPEAAGMLTDGSIVIREMIFKIPESGFEPVPVIARHVTLDEATPDTVLEGKGPRFGPVTWSDGGSIVTSPLFESGLMIAAAGERIVTADCREPEFRELEPEPEARLRRIVRWDGGDRTVRPEDVERLRQAEFAEDEDPEDRRRTEEYMDARPANDLFPACAELFTPDGREVWVRSYWYLPDEPADWRVFRDGRFLGTFRLPAASRLMAVRGDRLATVELDELEVEHVQVYGLPIVLSEPPDR